MKNETIVRLELEHHGRELEHACDAMKKSETVVKEPIEHGLNATAATAVDRSDEHSLAAARCGNPPEPEAGETSNSESYLIRLCKWDKMTQIAIAPFDTQPYPQIFD